MKYYDKEIERRKTSIVEAITILIVFLVSFWAGYIAGEQEREKNEEVSNMQVVSMYKEVL